VSGVGAGDLAAVIAGALLVLGTGGALALALRIEGGAELALASLVLAAGVAIALTEALSPLHGVTRPGLLGGAAVAAALAGAAWWRAGRPFPRIAAPSPRGHGAVAAVVGAAALAVLAQLVLALLVVPNEVDGLLYHLLRSAMVVQDHTAVPFHPALRGDPASMNPANAELLVAWTMALSHGDRLAGLVQWACLPALGALVFAGARELGFARPAAAFAGAVAVLAPEPLLQATTVQTDLVLSVLIGSAALFAVRGVRRRTTGDLVVAGAAAGLALGTKTSAIVAAPFVALLVLAAARRARTPRRLLGRAAVLAVAGALVLGSFAYAEDLARTGDPLGGMTASTARDFTRASPALNVARSAWSVFVEAPGLPRVQPLERALDPLRFALFGHVNGSYYSTPTPVRFTVDEDTNGLGMVGLLILVPLLALAIVRPRGRDRRALALAGLGFAAVLVAHTGYSPDNSRLVLPGLVLTLPLLAAVARHRRLRVAVAVLAVAGAVPAVLLNPHRSPFSDPAVIGHGRIGQQLVDYAGTAQMIDALNRIVPPNAPLGVFHPPEFTYSSHPAYAFFGAHFQRRILLLGEHDLSIRRLRALRLAGAVVWWPDCDGAACRLSLSGVPHRWLGSGGEFIDARKSRPRRALQATCAAWVSRCSSPASASVRRRLGAPTSLRR